MNDIDTKPLHVRLATLIATRKRPLLMDDYEGLLRECIRASRERDELRQQRDRLYDVVVDAREVQSFIARTLAYPPGDGIRNAIDRICAALVDLDRK